MALGRCMRALDRPLDASHMFEHALTISPGYVSSGCLSTDLHHVYTLESPDARRCNPITGEGVRISS